MSDLLQLAERCEAATGPWDVLDSAIWRATAELPKGWRWIELDGRWCQAGWTHSDLDTAPHITTSIDAALTLVPEGWDRWICDADDGRCICRLDRGDDGLPELELGANAATWPLAICAAALRARSALQSPNTSGHKTGGLS